MAIVRPPNLGQILPHPRDPGGRPNYSRGTAHPGFRELTADNVPSGTTRDGRVRRPSDHTRRSPCPAGPLRARNLRTPYAARAEPPPQPPPGGLVGHPPHPPTRAALGSKPHRGGRPTPPPPRARPHRVVSGRSSTFYRLVRWAKCIGRQVVLTQLPHRFQRNGGEDVPRVYPRPIGTAPPPHGVRPERSRPHGPPLDDLQGDVIMNESDPVRARTRQLGDHSSGRGQPNRNCRHDAQLRAHQLPDEQGESGGSPENAQPKLRTRSYQLFWDTRVSVRKADELVRPDELHRTRGAAAESYVLK